MNHKDKIISALAEAACEEISRKVIRSLRKMTAGMQSGDDSPLKNIWDEVCVQIQDQESAVWDYYLETVESLVMQELKGLDDATKQAIWLQTYEGSDWSCDNEDGETADFVDDDMAIYIVNNFVLSEAANFTNQRIEKYLERGMEI